MKRRAIVGDYCVACGSCLKVCPRDAIEIWKGVIAKVNMAKCVGCGLCANECPAGTIDVVNVEGE